MILLPTVDDVMASVQNAGGFRQAFRVFTPRPDVQSLAWAEEHIVNEFGKPYDNSAYPHIGAPGGPLDAIDDAWVRTISLQWGVRLGKSFVGHCLQLKTARENPSPMMLVSSSQKLAREITDRLYVMINQRRSLTSLLVQPERFQRNDLIEFRGCKLYVGWAKSASTLADKNIKVGHANEIDKWKRHSTSTEGDPLELFEDRFNDYYVHRKVLFESTPSEKGRSRIERLRLLGWNCRFEVPCPHCKQYQVLAFGDMNVKWGVKWEKAEDGRSDLDVARSTAVYVCRHCEQAIKSDARNWMMRRGVWCPEGCTVRGDVALAMMSSRDRPLWKGWKNAPWVDGVPLRDGEDASYHLSTLCALKLPLWGDFAKRFLRVCTKQRSLQTFVNQWFAETFEPTERKTTWQQLAEKIASTTPRGMVPAGFGLVTIGVDKQQDSYPYVVDAWANGRRSHTVAYGVAANVDELNAVITADWACETGGTLRAGMTLIDSGYRPGEVHDFVAELHQTQVPVHACRGANKPLNAYYLRRRNSKKSSNPGKWVIWVDTQMTQDFIDRQLHVLKVGDAGAMTVFEGAVADHQDFCEQLLNDAPVSKIDGTNNVAESWNRIDDEIPNDMRDARRYAFVAMMLKTRGALIPTSAPTSIPKSVTKPIRKGLTSAPKFSLLRGSMGASRITPGK